ncbi:hypothetical protein APL35_gp137 [Apis mellifera filamentous virus]|uniref:hypothetical protein n=1 Tax=Apis mellifera filamentous virus TaxID=1100043 RepID=UPI0006BC925A|nr:hypothetical protein APL35_gp137 [Apis mellifera filamentous virus]
MNNANQPQLDHESNVNGSRIDHRSITDRSRTNYTTRDNNEIKTRLTIPTITITAESIRP